MRHELTAVETAMLDAEAKYAVGTIARKYRLKASERSDAHQDLLLDLLTRLKSFDPTRGSLRTFARTVFRHRTVRLANRLHRERVHTGTLSLDALLEQEAGDDRAIEIAEAGAQRCDVELQLDLDRALGVLEKQQIQLCAALLDSSPTEVSANSSRSRAGIYRDIREIRLRFLAEGLSAAA